MDLRAGDIILECDESDDAVHVLLWVDDGRGKHIVHSKDVGTLLGVVQQSTGALRRSDDDTSYLVHRHVSAALAAKAAAFALRWATRSDDPMVAGMVGFAEANGRRVTASTPFGRRGDEFQTCGAWDAAALVRAVRAWSRGYSRTRLSGRKGVSCSQFVTYCYQAASLDDRIRQACHHEDWRRFLTDPESFVALKKRNRYDIVAQALALLQLDPQLSVGLRFDAKSTDAQNLQGALDMDDAFDCVGRVAVDDWNRPGRAWIEPPEEED